MTKFRVLSLDKTHLKLQHFMEKKVRIWRALSEKEKIHKVLMYERIKLMRQIYLYTNRYIRKNNNIIENSNKDFHHLWKTLLDKSIQTSSEIPDILLEMQGDNHFTHRDCARVEVALKNIRYFKYLYYERKAFVATTLMVRLPSTDLCRKITDYLY